MATTKDILIEAINSGYSTPEEVVAAKAALATLNAPPVPLAVAPAEPSTGPDMGDNLAGQFNRDEYFEKMRRAEPNNPEYTVEAEEAFELLHFSESVQAHLAVVGESDARFANIKAECTHLAKTLFPNDPRLDQTAFLIDRALSSNWPLAYGPRPTGEWSGESGVPVPVPSVPALSVSEPTQNEKSTNLQIQQLLSDDHRLGIFSRPEPEAPPAAPKSDIDQLIEHERRLLDQQDAADSRRWNRAMGLSPAFQPGGFRGND